MLPDSACALEVNWLHHTKQVATVAVSMAPLQRTVCCLVYPARRGCRGHGRKPARRMPLCLAGRVVDVVRAAVRCEPLLPSRGEPGRRRPEEVRAKQWVVPRRLTRVVIDIVSRNRVNVCVCVCVCVCVRVCE